MKVHRFICNFNTDSPELCITDLEIIHQIKNVLRLQVGEIIEVSDGKGNEARAKIIEFGKSSVTLHVIRAIENNTTGAINTILYCSLLKNKNFELVVQKATEVGIKTIVPIITQRTVKHGFNYFRIQKIVKEASEQCGRSSIPLVCHPMDFNEAVEDAIDNSINFFFHKDSEKFNPKEIQGKPLQRVGIFIGPEGGWHNTDLELAKERNFKIRSLGKLTLRAETAAIIASYIVESNC